MPFIVPPIRISFEQWVYKLITDLKIIRVPNPPPVEKWKDWAEQLIQDNKLRNVPSPNSNIYKNPDDWRKWGESFLSSINNL